MEMLVLGAVFGVGGYAILVGLVKFGCWLDDRLLEKK